MDWFEYRDGQLHCEGVHIATLAAEEGTPLYVYSRRTFEHHYDAIAHAFSSLDPTICYAVKSCDNLSIMKLMVDRGAGLDTVSGGEIRRAREIGADMSKVVFAGVGKTDSEIRLALESGIGLFNIESEAEFENIASIAKRMGVKADAALRVNPDVDPETAHAKTTTGKKESKFGVDIDRARRFFEKYGRDSQLRLCGVHLHIGSPVFLVEPYVKSIEKALQLIEDVRSAGLTVDKLDIGGGFGADYETGQTPDYAQYAERIVPLLKPFQRGGGRIYLEPGRTISCNAGILVSRVTYIKMGGRKKFVIVDTGMHHMIRPTLYDAWMFIWPVHVAPEHVPDQRSPQMDCPGLEPCDVVGPICETGDYLAKDRLLPPVARDDLMAMFGAGAYGSVMACHYNTFPRPAEVLVEGDRYRTIRRRETYDDLLAPEREPAALGA